MFTLLLKSGGYDCLRLFEIGSVSVYTSVFVYEWVCLFVCVVTRKYMCLHASSSQCHHRHHRHHCRRHHRRHNYHCLHRRRPHFGHILTRIKEGGEGAKRSL